MSATNKAENHAPVAPVAPVAPIAAAAAAAQGHEVMAKSFEISLAVLMDSAAQTSKAFETSQASVQEGVKQGVTKALKTAQTAVAFGQGNVEAFIEASRLLTTGMQDLSRQMARAAQEAVDHRVAFAKALVEMTSPQQAIDLQASFARGAIEKAGVETAKLAEASVKLAAQSMTPLTARFARAVSSFGETV